MAFHLLTQDEQINAKAKHAASNVNLYSSIRLIFMTAVIICAYSKLFCAAGLYCVSPAEKGKCFCQ